MDKNKNVDSQDKKAVTAVDLKEKIKKRLEKQSEIVQESKTGGHESVTRENAPAVGPVLTAEPAFSPEADPLSELDIEELMKKYLPESDLKYAHPAADDDGSEPLEIREAGPAGESPDSETVPEAPGSDNRPEDIDDIVGQAGIVRKDRMTGMPEFYSDGKVGDEYVGDENIYDDPEDRVKPEADFTGELKPDGVSTGNEILKVREKLVQPVEKSKTEIGTPPAGKETGAKQTGSGRRRPVFGHKSVQQEQQELLTGTGAPDGSGGNNLPDTGLVPNKTLIESEIDDTDVKLMMAFGMEEELASTVGFDKVSEVEEKLDRTNMDQQEAEGLITGTDREIEFTSASQTKGIFRTYRKKYSSVLVRLLIGLVLLITAFLFENITVFGGSLPASLDMAVFPLIHIMFDLQLLLIGGALIYRQVIGGTAALLKLKAVPESIMAVLLIVSVLYQLAACFVIPDAGLRMYAFPVLLGVFLTLIYEFLNLKREIFCFNIVASKRAKFAIVKLANEEAELETEAFSQLLPENPHIFKIGRTMFADGFFARMRSVQAHHALFNTVIFSLLAVSVMFFVLGYVFDGQIYSDIALAYIALLISMPLSVFITYSYPFYKASKEAYGVDSAILGESSLAEYSDANAISFDDKDVFPSYGVKVKSVKVYGENRIDYIIFNAASLFIKTGGPLADVFEIATRDLGHSDHVELIKVDSNGIEAVIEGAHIFMGKAAYIRSKGFYPKTESDENANDEDGDNSVMYMVLNDELAAKMYVQYVIDPDFEFVIKQLHKIGICVGIKTFDPNIDDAMMSTKIKISKYPVKVLKCKTTADVNEVSDRLESGILSKNSAKALLQTLSLCDKVTGVTKNNLIVKIFSVVISVILSAIIMILGMAASIPSVFIALYQIFWMIPMIIITRIFIGRI